MAKAAGRPAPAVQEKAAWDDAELREFAARLEDLARAQDEARSAVGDDEANYTVAFEQLFVAVARLNPLHGAALIRPLAQSSVVSRLGHPCDERKRARGCCYTEEPVADTRETPPAPRCPGSVWA